MTTRARLGPVVFDGGVLADGPVTGVGRSLLTALEAYAELAERPPILLLPRGAAAPAIAGLDVVAAPRNGVVRRALWPRTARRLRARLLHNPVAAVPAHSPCPVVATVHDVPWRVPESVQERESLAERRAEPGTGWRHRRALRRAARRAQAIVTPSQATRRDLERELGDRLRARIVVVPHGVPAPARLAPPDARGAFLVLGDDRPRKNLDRVRRAHEIARRMQSDLPDLELVGPGFGYVSEAEKGERLRGARALLHVSLFEGFGLPVVEAFAHGVPVVTSDRASLPEVAGDAALLVDPTDVDAIARAIVRVHTDAALRAALRERGLARARGFTPEATARAFARLHRELAP